MKRHAVASPGLVAVAGFLALLVAVVALVPQADAEKAKQDTGEAFEWSMDADCSACHVLEAASFDAQAPEAVAVQKDVAKEDGEGAGDGQDPAGKSCLALLHNGDCATCHTDVETMEKRHGKKGVTAEKAAKLKRLKKTDVEAQECLACHGAQEELAEATEDSTVLTDEKGRVQNPHALPSEGPHAKATCGDCHVMHKDSSLEETAREYCASCHHGGLYECYTCHG